jgi:DNA adenine methylase
MRVCFRKPNINFTHLFEVYNLFLLLFNEIKPVKMLDLNNTKDVPAKPFLRWAGGKRWLTKHIQVINGLEINNYFEPFLGGGSVFFNTKNYNNAYLSDLNPELIETYQCIRDDVKRVINELKKMSNNETEYYQIRSSYPNDKYERAAKFIYLNKTSFNGIYRVNKNGIFNVPYGFRKNIDLVDQPNLSKVSERLKSVIIEKQDFFDIEKKIQKSDFIFLDPPYTVAHENNGFIEYNQKIFSIEDQKRLSLLIEKIKDLGAYYIMTNAKHDAILEIYKSIDKPIVLSRSSTVGGIGAKREIYNEYIYSNFLY